MAQDPIEQLLTLINERFPGVSAFVGEPDPSDEPGECDDRTDRVVIDVPQSSLGWTALALLAKAVQDCRNPNLAHLRLGAWHDRIAEPDETLADTLKFEIVWADSGIPHDLALQIESTLDDERQRCGGDE